MTCGNFRSKLSLELKFIERNEIHKKHLNVCKQINGLRIGERIKDNSEMKIEQKHKKHITHPD